MEDSELIAKISRLKEIKPREDWVILTRARILDSDSAPSPLRKRRFFGIVGTVASLPKYFERPAFVIPALSVLVGGGLLWQTAINSLPGDALYPVRAAVERVPVRFSAEEEKPFLQIQLTYRRLDDLRRIARDNKVQNLPSAIKELEMNMQQASKSLAAFVENQPEKALQAGKGIVELQKETSEIEKVLGTEIGAPEGEGNDEATRFLKQIVERELADLEARVLTEEQQAIFESARESFEKEDYQAAFESIWLLANTTE